MPFDEIGRVFDTLLRRDNSSLERVLRLVFAVLDNVADERLSFRHLLR